MTDRAYRLALAGVVVAIASVLLLLLGGCEPQPAAPDAAPTLELEQCTAHDLRQR
jgi:hypothetical protein